MSIAIATKGLFIPAVGTGVPTPTPGGGGGGGMMRSLKQPPMPMITVEDVKEERTLRDIRVLSVEENGDKTNG